MLFVRELSLDVVSWRKNIKGMLERKLCCLAIDKENSQIVFDSYLKISAIKSPNPEYIISF